MTGERLPATPGQTVGPFFGFALPFAGGPDVVPPGSPGAVRLAGRVLDGAGDPVPDALVETWQAGADGVLPHQPGSLHRDGYTFTGWGRAATDREGRYALTTLAPGPTSTGAAPFFAVCVLARGLLDRLLTRAYLPDDEQALDADPLLTALGPRERATLVCARDDHGFRFDVRLQGEDETVFLRYH